MTGAPGATAMASGAANLGTLHWARNETVMRNGKKCANAKCGVRRRVNFCCGEGSEKLLLLLRVGSQSQRQNTSAAAVFGNGRVASSSSSRTFAVATSTESSVSVKPVEGSGGDGLGGNGEDELPSLSNKPVLTMQPPVRKPPTSPPASENRDLQGTPPLKPAPKPVLRLRLRESSAGAPGQSQGVQGAVGRTGRPFSPRPDGKRVEQEQQEHSNGEAGPSTSASTSPVQNLNQILQDVEKLGGSGEDAPRAPARAPRNVPAQSAQPRAWKAGDKIRSKAEREKAEIEEREKAAAAYLESRSNAEEATTSSSSSSSFSSSSPSSSSPSATGFSPSSSSQIAKPQPPRLTTLAKPVLTPPPAAGAKAIRKGPVLRDIGAAPKSPQSQQPRSAAASPSAAATTGPPKAFTKAPPPKGKEDWRKKANNSVSDGAKRRVSVRNRESSLEGAADLNIDIPGASPARRGGRKMNKASRKAIRVEAARAAAPVKVEILEVGPDGMSCQELAEKLAVNDSEIVKVLFMKGIGITVNQTLDEETVNLVCKEFDVEVVEAGAIKVEDMAKKTASFSDEADLDFLIPRPPVVTVMGHVDHGKTSLLDFIRKSKVAAGEAGGITQGIGAYTVNVRVDDEVQSCVFLDTPGHEAFSAMRARGARVTDIAVIVVAADDGVRPQTLEAIAHAKAANVPIVIAITKIDKDGANPQTVLQELSTHGLMPEEWGGDVPMVQVSAKSGENIDALLENIMLVSELQELKANPDRSAQGTVIDASLDKARGALATVLVQNGTLHKGDVVLCGGAYGKVRVLMDYTGNRVESAGPSTAVQILGLNTVPVAGDEFEIMDTLDGARSKAAEHTEVLRNSRLIAQAGEGKVTLHSFANAVAASQETGVERHQLNIILKVDAQGSVEAIREVLQGLPQDTVALRFLMQSTGEISASDIDLAAASGAVVVGFNVGLQPGVQTQADTVRVEIRSYRVIYDLVDDIRKAMEGLLGNVEEEVPIGQAEVRAVFGAGSGRVAGCMVTEGKLVKGAGARVTRGGVDVHVGLIDSLRRVKELAKEIVAGLECGVGVDGFSEWQEGDTIMAFRMVGKKRTLEDASVTVRAAVAAMTNNGGSS